MDSNGQLSVLLHASVMPFLRAELVMAGDNNQAKQIKQDRQRKLKLQELPRLAQDFLNT